MDNGTNLTLWDCDSSEVSQKWGMDNSADPQESQFWEIHHYLWRWIYIGHSPYAMELDRQRLSGLDPILLT